MHLYIQPVGVGVFQCECVRELFTRVPADWQMIGQQRGLCGVTFVIAK